MPSTHSLGDVTKARSAWAHVAVTVEELVSLCPTMSEEDRNRILQPLHTVEQRMEEKAVRDARKANAETSPETAVVDAAMEEDAEGETDSEIDDTPDTGNDAAGS